MKRFATFTALLAAVMLSATALASDARTSASAGSRRHQRNGTAAATAHYQGQLGFARTNARSGPVSSARGVAVGVDESGLSLSVSHAVAPRRGPAVAANFNLSIGNDGRVSGSTGLSLASGPLYRSASAGGRAGTGRFGSTAVSRASGKTDGFGRVFATTRAHNVGFRCALDVQGPPCGPNLQGPPCGSD